jgi:hypothetical protein
MAARVRWVIAASLALYSFLGPSNKSALDWLTTSKGRLCLLLAALGIAFWPQLRSEGERLLLRIRPISKRRLWRETDAIATDLEEFVRTHDTSAATTVRGFSLSFRLENVEDQNERDAIWAEHMTEVLENHEKQAAELREFDGGRVSFVLREYERRGLLSESERIRLEFWASFTAMAAEAADRLRGLAKRIEPVGWWRRR